MSEDGKIDQRLIRGNGMMMMMMQRPISMTGSCKLCRNSSRIRRLTFMNDHL